MQLIDFNDTATAFELRTNCDLRRAAWRFRIMSNRLIRFAHKLHLPIAWIVNPTLYGHFVPGKTLDDSIPRLNELREQDVKATMYYSAEASRNEEERVLIYSEMVNSVRFASDHRNLISHAIFKPGGLVPVNILVRYAEQPDSLSEDEKEEITLFYNRFMELCRLAYDLDMPILVDAQYHAYQAVIDRFTEEAMQHFNRHRTIVYTTLQMYKKDRLEYLKHLLDKAEKEDLNIGIKLVRGAYLQAERKRAKEKGYSSPICDTKEDTDQQYNEALRFIVAHLDRFSLVCGTHNEQSCQVLAQLMEQNEIASGDPRIVFAQLYGMSDHVSFNLANAGYNVTKYAPYGAVRKVAPYLMRRIEECASGCTQIRYQRSLIQKELKRRRTENEA